MGTRRGENWQLRCKNRVQLPLSHTHIHPALVEGFNSPWPEQRSMLNGDPSHYLPRHWGLGWGDNLWTLTFNPGGLDCASTVAYVCFLVMNDKKHNSPSSKKTQNTFTQQNVCCFAFRPVFPDHVATLRWPAKVSLPPPTFCLVCTCLQAFEGVMSGLILHVHNFNQTGMTRSLCGNCHNNVLYWILLSLSRKIACMCVCVCDKGGRDWDVYFHGHTYICMFVWANVMKQNLKHSKGVTL